MTESGEDVNAAHFQSVDCILKSSHRRSSVYDGFESMPEKLGTLLFH